MTEKKKRAPRASVVHGVTDQGIQVAPGRFVPAPPITGPANPHLFVNESGVVWGWSCTKPGCKGHRTSVKWDEAAARFAHKQHTEKKHP